MADDQTGPGGGIDDDEIQRLKRELEEAEKELKELENEEGHHPPA